MRGVPFQVLNLRVEMIGGVCVEKSDVTESATLSLMSEILHVGIRTALLESDDHTCPTCHQNDVSPDALIANKFLRQVAIFVFLL